MGPALARTHQSGLGQPERSLDFGRGFRFQVDKHAFSRTRQINGGRGTPLFLRPISRVFGTARQLEVFGAAEMQGRKVGRSAGERAMAAEEANGR